MDPLALTVRINIIYHTFYILSVSRLIWIGWMLSDCCLVQSGFLSCVLKCGTNMSCRNPELAQPGGGGTSSQRSLGCRQCHPSPFWWYWHGGPVQSVDADHLGGAHRYHILSIASTLQLTRKSLMSEKRSLPLFVHRFFFSSSYSPAVACGERGSSPAAVRELTVLLHSSQ